MIICVTGPRGLPASKFFEVDDIMEDIHAKFGIDHLGVGDAFGVDYAVAEWAAFQGIPFEVFHADWNKFGKGAGPIRNRQMLEKTKPEALIAILVPTLPCRGTWNCIETAMELDIRIYPYRVEL